MVANDLSPADMMQFKQSVFAGFVTDVGDAVLEAVDFIDHRIAPGAQTQVNLIL